MNLRRENLKRTVRAPAKLNLFLDVLGRRDDGFHEVETLMVPIRLSDSLEFQSLGASERNIPAEIRLDVRMCGPLRPPQAITPVPIGAENLVVRVLELLRQRSGCEQGAHVRLVKRIPSSAGLGGGSSDAAAALRLANLGWNLHWPVEQLAEVAAEIGSDVPFFLFGGAAVCRGRGERVEPLSAMKPIHVVVVQPPVGFNTREVYRAYNICSGQLEHRAVSRGRLVDVLNSAVCGRAHDLGHWMQNGLQKAASSLSPWVDKLRMAFAQLDFLGHQLSGSGSAYFGVCRHAQHARRLANILRTRQLGFVYATHSCQ